MAAAGEDHRSLTLREAADDLGVHYMTAYRYVRSGRLPARKVGDEWQVRRHDLEAFRAGPAPRGRRRRAPHHERFEARLLAGDEGGAWSVVSTALGGGMGPDTALAELVVPALRSIGDRWARGELAVADEHRATQVALRIVSRLGGSFARPGRKRGTVVLGAVSGDHHSLPTAIMADLLRGAGFTVVDLGAHTPASAFVDAARAVDRLRVVGVCVTLSDRFEEVSGVVAALRAAGIDVPVAVGGSGVPGPDAALAAGADGYAEGPPESVELFCALADAGRPGAPVAPPVG